MVVEDTGRATESSILNNPASTESFPGLLHELFEQSVESHGDSIALSFVSDLSSAPKEYTYNELDRIANDLAWQLVERGHRGQIIPVVLPQCVELYVSILAILKSGNIYCPILPETGLERTTFICKDLGAKVIITSRATRTSLPTKYELFHIDLSRCLNRHAPRIDVAAADLAYTMYTSGSTGTPKAVMISHCSATTSIRAHDALFEASNMGDTMLQFANSTFDISIFEIFSAWTRGLKLLGVQRSVLLSNLSDVIAKHKVAYLELTPSMAGLLPDKNDNRMSSIKMLITIGELLTKKVISNWYGKLVNAYGPTEATLHASYTIIDDANASPADIGLPLETCSLVILDPDSTTILAPGVIGELCVAGAQVADGYLNRPDLTNAAFIKHPGFSGRLYRTGDLAQIRAGRVYFVGRKAGDTQVKINGQRIELGEIAHAIESDKRVSSCTVIRHKRQLFAFVLLNTSPQTPEKFEVSQKLPLDVRPRFIVLENMPTSAAGKRDNRRLVELAEQFMTAEHPSSDSGEHELEGLEKLVLKVVQQIVPGIVNLGQSFRSLGVDSLTSIKIVMALLDNGYRTTVFDVLEEDSIGGLMRRITSVETEDEQHPESLSDLSEQSLSELSAKHGKGSHFAKATNMQSSMLAATLSDPQGHLYYNHIQLKLNEYHSHVTIQAAWNSLRATHEILRTGFDSHVPPHEECDFIQVIHPIMDETIQHSCVDSSDLHNAFLRHRQSKALAAQNLHEAAIDLRLISCASETYLSLMIHHALYDAWSLELMLAQFASCLQNSELSMISPQYRAIAGQVSDHSRPTKEKQAYWTKYLSDVVSPRLPILAQHAIPDSEKQRTSRPFSMSLADLDQACLKKGTNPQAVGQLAWATLLSWTTGESLVSMSITTSGRTHPVKNLDRTLGPFVSTYPFVFKVDSELPISQGILEVNQYNHCLSKYDMTYRDILRHSSDFQSPDTLFIYQKTGTDLASQHLIEIVDQVDRLEFKAMVTFDRTRDGMVLHFDADPALVAVSAAERLLHLLDLVSYSILSANEGTFGTLRDIQDNSLLSMTNTNPDSMIMGRLNEIVEGMAADIPDEPALQFYDTYESSSTLSYKELNNAAMRLAKSAAEAQLLPDDIVAICLNKSLDMYVSMLAIHKLGCGYLALEPALPDERISTILEVTKCQYVFTDTDNAARFPDQCVNITAEVLKNDTTDVEFESRPTNGLAYVLMTSGTTGIPKACLVTHSNVLSNCDVLSKLYPHAQEDRMMQFTSYAFDVSVFEIFWSWYNGMCLVSTHKDLMLSNLTKALQDFDITHLNMTASAAALIQSSSLPKIKCFITSGEPSTRSIIRDWGPSRRYFNAYGPTETTNVCSARLVDSGNIYPSSIGPPLKNSSGYVLDDKYQVLPLFSIGELFVGGAQVIRGYLGDDKRTQEQFIEHEKYGRLYRTGDVVRILEDGTISIAGRIDSQVKLRGHRIELDEISHTIKALSNIADAATIVHENNLVSFVRTSASESQDRDAVVAEIKRRTAKVLPTYMCPSTVIVLQHAIPLTSTYKIDTRKLVEILRHDKQRRKPGKAQTIGEIVWTEKTRRLAEIISRFAKVSMDDMTPYTSIAQLGLDSISAIRISSAIRDAKLGQLNVSSIMTKGTPVGMADELDNTEQVSLDRPKATWERLSQAIESVKDTILSDLELDKSEVEVILPCTSLQEGLLLETLKDDSIAYINHSILKLQSHVDSTRLQEACRRLVAKTQMLRACFAYTTLSTVPCLQVILKAADLSFTTLCYEQDTLNGALEKWKKGCKQKFGLQRPSARFLELQLPEGHYLIISLHHSLFDGWSLSLLHRDLEQFYLSNESTIRPQLQTLMPSVFEACSTTEKELHSWSQYLSDYQPFSFPLLTDTRSEDQNILCSPLSTSLTSLTNLATEQSISVLSILQSAWSILLAAVSGSMDVCFANVVSGRTVSANGIEEAVIPLFNVLPARLNMSKHKSIGSVLAAFSRYNKSLLDNPHYPLRNALKAGKFAPDEQAFDTILILQRPQEHRDSELIQAVSDDGDSNYAVMVECIPDPKSDTMTVRLTAKSHRVSSTNLELLVKRLDDLLYTIVKAEQGARVQDLTSKRELRSINGSAVPTHSPDFLHSAFLRNSQSSGHQVAIEYMDESSQSHEISYSELGVRSITVASHLHTHSLKQGTPIVVMMSSAPEVFIAFLGVLQAGMVYTPLAIDTPPERLAHILRELSPGLILVDDAALETPLRRQFPEIPCMTLSQISDSQQTSLQSLTITPDDLAYIIYTSGSTGKPKAVMISHAAAVAAVESSRSLLRTKKTSKWLQFASITFDMSVYDMSIAFSFGITLCGAPKSTLLNDLPAAIQKLGATHLDLTPSVAKTLRKADLPSVEVLFCIGEKLSYSIIREWGSSCLNVYGPTEASMACSLHNVTEDSVASNIGHPFKHAQLAIFDREQDKMLPLADIGEICIAGPQLSKGYLHNAEMTEKSFFEFEGTRFYRTGDLCRMLADLSLSYVDRKDGQTKLRGQRIELEEINSVLVQTHPHIKSVSTLVMSSKDHSSETLVSFISKEAKGTSVDGEIRLNAIAVSESSDILESIAAYLPSYMMPSHLLRVEYIPLNAARKVDKRRLISMWQSYEATLDHVDEESLGDDSYTEIEETIRQAFSTISGTDKASINKKTSIQRLGLDSISAMQISAILKRSNLKVSVVDILKNPTVEKLSKRINLSPACNSTQSRDSTTINENYSKLNKSLKKVTEHRLPIYACTPTQENMLAQFIQSSGTAYYNHILFSLQKTTDCQKLREAWLQVIESNDILRAGFATIDRQECQYAMIIHPLGTAKQMWNSIEVKNEDVSSIVSKQIERLSSERLKDLSIPSLQLHLLQTASDNYLLVSAHHALYDGYSLQMIHNSVLNAYKGVSLLTFGQLEVSAGALWNVYHDQALQDRSQLYWQKRLSQSLFVPFPNLNNQIDKDESSTTRHLISTASLSSFESLCKRAGTSLANTSMLAWAKILSCYTGELSVNFGVVLSGRTGMELDAALFPCLTTVPFSYTLDKCCADSLLDIDKLAIEALEYQHIALNRLKREDGSNLFDTLFVYQRQAGDALNCDLWSLSRDYASVEVPISIEVLPNDESGELTFSLTYQPARIPDSHAEILLQQYDQLLLQILQNPDISILDIEEHLPREMLSILPPSRPILNSPVKLLHDYVRHFARLTPDAIAMEFADDLDSVPMQWCYKDLDDKSNSLANLLIEEYQLTDNRPLAICFDKSPEAFISILAALKTGAPFCCLDSSAPIDRRAFIIENCGAAAVLCGELYAEDLRSKVQVQVIVINELEAIGSSTRPVNKQQDDSSLCYILYTSGSTGTPKGCCLSHNSVVQAMESFKTQFCGRYNQDSRFLAFASLHFDVSILESYFSWSIGARVCAAPKDALLSDIPGAIKKFGITHLDLTPQLAMTLLPEDAKTLQVFITGGEMLRSETVNHWGDSGVLFNFYGPTEATIGCTALRQVRKRARPSNIGQQWTNCGSMVQSLMGKTKPALRGAVGNLVISGTQVAEGYMKLPEATSKRFKYSEDLKDRTYDTGDLVRLLEVDLSFDFAGRADSQVKLRGQRIETGEIDSVLVKSSAGSLVEAVTLVMKHHSQQKDQLVSFVVFRADHNPRGVATVVETQETLDQHFRSCRASLPSYMVPSYIVPLTKIDLTPTNKVDSKKISSLYNNIASESLMSFAAQRSTGKNKIANRNIVQSIKSCLTDITGVTDIGDHTSAFELGLDSVSIVGFVRKLKTAGFDQCSVATVMTSEDVLDLASHLDVHDNKQIQRTSDVVQKHLDKFYSNNISSAAEQLKVSEADIEHVLPCTPLIEGLLVESIHYDARLHYNRFDLICNHSVDIQRLTAAFNALISQSPMLRSKFIVLSEGIAHIVIRPDIQCPEASSPDFPLRSKLVNLILPETPAQNISIEIHHALYDGHSLNLIIADLSKLYEDLDSPLSRPSFLPVVMEILAVDLEAAKESWSKQLTAATAHLPARRSSQVFEHSAELDISLTDLERCAQTLSCTPNVLCQAVWSLITYHLLGGDSIFGLVVAGRNMAVDAVSEIVYPSFNTLPIYVEVSRVKKFQDLIRALQQFYGQALTFEHMPLREIKKVLGIPSDVPLVDAVFVYQKEDTNVDAQTFRIVDNTSEASSGFAIAMDITTAEHSRTSITVKLQDIGVDARDLCSCFEDTLRALLGRTSYDKINEIILNHALISKKDILVESWRRHNGPKSDRRERRPLSDTAQKIRQIVAELAKLAEDELDPEESFFVIGLDSVDIIKLSARLKQQLQLNFSVSQILQSATVVALASLVKTSVVNDQSNRKSSIPDNFASEVSSALNITYAFEDIMPVSPIQSGILTTSGSFASGTSLYLNHTLVKLARGVSPAQLSNAWEKLIEAHSILRTTFESVSQLQVPVPCTFVQVIRPRVSSLSIDRQNVTEDDLFAQFKLHQQRAATESETPGTAPLFLQLYQTEKALYQAISIHHALYDGASLEMLFQELQDIIFSNQEPQERPPYSLLIEHVLQTSRSRSELFWAQYLKDCTPKLVSASESTESDKCQLSSIVNINKARQVAKSLGVSLQALTQAVFAVYLMETLQLSDVLFGTIQAGRSFVAHAEQILGPCMNTLPIRALIQQGTTYATLAKDLHQANLSMIDYIHSPLSQVQKQIGKGPLFETLFVYQSQDEAAKPLKIWTPVVENSSVEFPLAVECSTSLKTLQWTVAVHKGQDFSADQVAHKVDHILERLLEQVDGVIFPETSSIFVTQQSNLDQDSSSSEDEDDGFSLVRQDEILIIELLSEMTKIDVGEISRNTSIFSMGLDSISAIELSKKLKTRGLQLSVGEILRNSTVKDMHRVVALKSQTTPREQKTDDQDQGRGLIDHEALKIVATQIHCAEDALESILPATAAQIYFLSAWRATKGTRFMSNFAFKIPAGMNCDTIKHRWHELCAKHSILRTAFTISNEGHEILQCVFKKPQQSMALYEAEGQSQEESLRSFFQADAFTQPDLTRPPVYLTMIEGAATAEPLLVLSIHHALYDAISLPMIIEALCGDTNTPSDLSYLDFTRKVRPKAMDTVSYWTTYLKDTRPFTLKPQNSATAPEAQTQLDFFSSGESRSFSLLEKLSSRLSVTIQSILLVAIAQALAAYDGRADAVLGLYSAGRSIDVDGIERMLGPTVNIVPVRVDGLDGNSPDKVIKAVHDALIQMNGFAQQVPVNEILKAAGWPEPRGLVDIAVNILPRRSTTTDERREREGEGSDSLQDYGRLSPACIETIRERYASGVDRQPTSIDGFVDLDCVNPTLDVEVEIVDDRVNMGIFCGGHVLNERQAGELVERIWSFVASL